MAAAAAQGQYHPSSSWFVWFTLAGPFYPLHVIGVSSVLGSDPCTRFSQLPRLYSCTAVLDVRLLYDSGSREREFRSESEIRHQSDSIVY
jgi:hypothetical protein